MDEQRPDQFELFKEQRARKLRTAQSAHNARIATTGRAPRSQAGPPAGRLWVVVVVLILVALAALVSPRSAHAQSADAQPTPGDGDILGDAMTAFRVGNYYFVKGDYARAAAWFAQAVDLTPAACFEQVPEASALYWALFAAQLRLEAYADAAVTVQRYVDVAGANADSVFVAHAQAQLALVLAVPEETEP